MPPGPESHQNPHNDSIPTGDLLACGLPRVLFHSPLPKRLGVVPAWYDLNVKLVDIEPGDPRLGRDVLPVLCELRTELTRELFAAVYEEGHRQGLRYLAAYDGQRCVGVAGWRVVANTAAIKKLYVDDLVTAASERSRGVGAALLTELAQRATALGCRLLDLDSGVQRADAHRFYMREGLTITSFHFTRRVSL